MSLLADIRYFYHYNTGSAKLPYMPSVVSIEPTNFCTLSCSMCPRSITGLNVERGYMDMALYSKIIKEISPTTSHLILDVGGEALLHPGIIDMIKIAKKSGLYVTFDTNATLMDENMARGILDAAPDRITFSFDGESKEIYETMRRGGDYEKVLNNIINFLKIRSQMSSKADVIIQHIKFYSEGEKLDVSDEFKNIFKGYNISKFDTVWAHKWMGVPDNCNYLDGYSGPPVNKDIYYPCPLLWNHFSIGWDGKVFPCNMDLLRLEVMGDVNKDSVRDIWNSRAFQEKRRLLLEKRYTCSSLCKTCAFLWERKEFKGTLLKRGVARFLRTFNRFKKYCG